MGGSEVIKKSKNIFKTDIESLLEKFKKNLNEH